MNTDKKIEEKAKALNETPQQFVDDTVKGFKETWKLLDITYDDFIRTTDERHVKVVKKSLHPTIKSRRYISRSIQWMVLYTL